MSFLKGGKQRPDSCPVNHPAVLHYQLREEETAQALRMLIDRRSPAARFGMGAVLFVLAAGCAVLYALHPYGIQYALLALLFALFAALVLWYPSWKAHTGAKAICRRGGSYRVTLQPDGYISLPDGTKVDLFGDPDSRACENNSVFAARPDRSHTFCIPKRVLSRQQSETVRSILQTYARHYVPSKSDSSNPDGTQT